MYWNCCSNEVVPSPKACWTAIIRAERKKFDYMNLPEVKRGVINAARVVVIAEAIAVVALAILLYFCCKYVAFPKLGTFLVMNIIGEALGIYAIWQNFKEIKKYYGLTVETGFSLSFS